jgi:hypothetical protein
VFPQGRDQFRLTHLGPSVDAGLLRAIVKRGLDLVFIGAAVAALLDESRLLSARAFAIPAVFSFGAPSRRSAS